MKNKNRKMKKADGVTLAFWFVFSFFIFHFSLQILQITNR